MKMSVVIPTYNEVECIGALLSELNTVLRSHEHEIIIVDDNSPDGTWQVVEEIGARLPLIRLIRRTGEKGLASALLRGIQDSTGQIVAWLDCDLQHPPEKLIELKNAIEQGADVASASRFCRNNPESGDARVSGQSGAFITRFHGILSYVLNHSITFLCRSKITDWTSGMVAFRRSALDQLAFRGDHGEYLMSLLFEAETRGMKIVEIPYILRLRRMGRSKSSDTYLGLYRLGLKYCRGMIKVLFSSMKPKASQRKLDLSRVRNTK